MSEPIKRGGHPVSLFFLSIHPLRQWIITNNAEFCLLLLPFIVAYDKLKSQFVIF